MKQEEITLIQAISALTIEIQKANELKEMQIKIQKHHARPMVEQLNYRSAQTR